MKKLVLVFTLFATTAFSQSVCNFTHSNAGALNLITFSPGAVLQHHYYHWTFGDNTSSTLLSPVHQYNSAGTFTVCLTIYDSLQVMTCQLCDTLNTSNPSGTCSFSSSIDTVTNVAVFTAQPSSSASTISWDLGDGHAGSGSSITHTYAGDTVYTVCMTETDTQSGAILCTSCGSIYTGPSNMNCSFTSAPDFLNPSSINFQAIAPAGSTVTWVFGDNHAGTGTNVHHTYNSTGYFQVCMTSIYNGVSCTFCDSVYVGNSSSNCTFSFTHDPINLNLINFVGVPGNGNSGIIWDFGDSTVGQGPVVSHLYAASGTYYVCMNEYFNGAIICTTCMHVTVNVTLPNCHAHFISANAGLTTYFIDLSTVNSSSVTYNWDFGDNATSNLRFPHHTYTHPGTYHVCLSILSAVFGCSDQYCHDITVDTLVNTNPGCNAFFAVLQLAPYQLAVVNLSTGSNLNFHWDFGDGSPISNLAFPSHHYNTTGSYILCLTVSDGTGCTSSYCDTLSVDSLGNIVYRGQSGFDVNVVSPSSLTGVQDISSPTHFAVYPNPVSSTLQISITDEMKSSAVYNVYALDGSQVTGGIFTRNLNTLSVVNWNSGAYILELRNAAGFKSYQKIIKE